MDNCNLFDFSGSPKDYSGNFYLVYIELGLVNSKVKKIIQTYCTIEKEMEFGYLCHVNNQNIPEIIRSLTEENHAVYQIIRLTKLVNTISKK